MRRVLVVGAGGLEPGAARRRPRGGDRPADAATRLAQEGIDGWAAGRPDAVVDGPRPAADLRADRRRRRLHSGRRPVHRHQSRPDLSDGTRADARGRVDRGGHRGGRGVAPVVDRQARAAPARGGGQGRRPSPERRGDDRRRAHGRLAAARAVGGRTRPDADRRDHAPNAWRRCRNRSGRPRSRRMRPSCSRCSSAWPADDETHRRGAAAKSSPRGPPQPAAVPPNSGIEAAHRSNSARRPSRAAASANATSSARAIDRPELAQRQPDLLDGRRVLLGQRDLGDGQVVGESVTATPRRASTGQRVIASGRPRSRPGRCSSGRGRAPRPGGSARRTAPGRRPRRRAVGDPFRIERQRPLGPAPRRPIRRRGP